MVELKIKNKICLIIIQYIMFNLMISALVIQCNGTNYTKLNNKIFKIDVKENIRF